MKRTRHSPEQIIAKLREADALLGGGATIGQVCQKLGVAEQTCHRWRDQYGGPKVADAKRLKELERENVRPTDEREVIVASVAAHWRSPSPGGRPARHRSGETVSEAASPSDHVIISARARRRHRHRGRRPAPRANEHQAC